MISARKLAIIAAGLELTGISLLVFLLISLSLQQTAVASPVVATTPAVVRKYKKQEVHGIPVHISVPSLGIATRVDKGYYDANRQLWSISEDAAYYATTTEEINTERGNTLIYGHNSNKIFLKLHDIKPGAKAYVKTANGYTFTYTLTATEDVHPGETDSLNYQGKPRLTLQTCTGFWNEKRQLSYFTLDSYKKTTRS